MRLWVPTPLAHSQIANHRHPPDLGFPVGGRKRLDSVSDLALLPQTLTQPAGLLCAGRESRGHAAWCLPGAGGGGPRGPALDTHLCLGARVTTPSPPQGHSPSPNETHSGIPASGRGPKLPLPPCSPGSAGRGEGAPPGAGGGGRTANPRQQSQPPS